MIVKIKSKLLYYWGTLVICIVVMLITMLVNKIVLYPDSYGYLEMSITRDPLYPLLLAFFRMIFGTNSFIAAVIIFQNLFGAYAIWNLFQYVKSVFSLNKWSSALLLLIQLGVMLGSSILSVSKIFIVSTILTESIAIPLCFLVFRYMMQSILELSFKPLIIGWILVLACMLLRGQLLYLSVVYLLVALYVSIRTRALKKKSLRIIVCFISLFILSNTLTKLYHLIINDVFASTPFGYITIFTKAMYLADPEDRELFSFDKNIQSQFDEIYHACENEKLLFEFSSGDIMQRYSHFENNYDKILYGTIYPILNKYSGNITSEENKRIIISDNLAKKMIVPLIFNNFGKYLNLALSCLLAGLIRSNSILIFGNQLIYWFGVIWSALFYLVAIILTIRNIKKKIYKSGLFMIFALITLLGNISIPVLVHYPLGRYTFYSMMPFYMAGFCLIIELVKSRGSAKNIDSSTKYQNDCKLMDN